MNRDTDLFVHAFWVKCRETIRPELDFTVDDLKSEGHDAHVATQEYSDVPDQLPDIGPSVILTVHPNGEAEGHKLRFWGDVAHGDVEVLASTGSCRRHELADVELAVVKAEISAWLTELLGRQG
jgi:hypothetical protein